MSACHGKGPASSSILLNTCFSFSSAFLVPVAYSEYNVQLRMYIKEQEIKAHDCHFNKSTAATGVCALIKSYPQVSPHASAGLRELRWFLCVCDKIPRCFPLLLCRDLLLASRHESDLLFRAGLDRSFTGKNLLINAMIITKQLSSKYQQEYGRNMIRKRSTHDTTNRYTHNNKKEKVRRPLKMRRAWVGSKRALGS